jgi:hypothetical protein
MPHLPHNALAFKLYRLYRFGKIYKNVFFSAISTNLKGNKIFNVSFKPKNTRVACRDTPDTNEAQGLKIR